MIRQRAGRALARAGAALALAIVACASPAALAVEDETSAGANTAAQPPASAVESAPPEPGGPAEARKRAREIELAALRRSLELSAAAQEQLRGEVAAIEADRAALSADLLRTAESLRRTETDVAALEERLADLRDGEDELRGSLRRRRAVLAEVLAALQRMGRTPPPALLSRPEDALGAIRGSILASSVLPVVRVEAEALAADLEELVALRSRIAADREELKRRYAALGEERARIDLLLASKRRLRETTEANLASERETAERLAGEARSLESLIANLERDVKAVQDAKAAAEAAAAAPAPADPADAARRLADTSRIAPAIAFADARGLLPLPVSGKPRLDFGGDDGLGGKAQGLSIAAEPGARVVSPADGWVVYAGPFRSYGQVLILNPGSGYHIVLAGMERIDAALGQFVLAGEPVASMGAQRLASLAATDLNSALPILYVEFRKDGTAVDPTPWWVRRDENEVKG